MMMEYWPVIATVASFVLTAIGMIVTVTWRLSRVVEELKQHIEAARDEVEAQQRAMGREFGETVSAIRQKVHDVETWARDTFVRQDSFYAVIVEIKATLTILGDKLEKRLERMEQKLDDRQ